MIFRISSHSKKHDNEKWNVHTILDAYLHGELRDTEILEGRTADVLYGYTKDGDCVGLVLSKPHDDTYIVITGFSAPLEYWRNV